ncbi:hypothetical protein LIR51_17885 [Blautia producta]|uniref:hypothetical protein n=1 Tax=Blautia producta TaxID=33035 RepID=UPI001D039E73|nr:hypothetical protein [Blautia producta]MCB5876688.1 hypothetical protein [Blautia producta]
MKMILHNGTTIPIVDGSYTGAVILIVDDRQALMDTWAQLTPDNLTGVLITKDDDTPLHTLHGAVVDSMQAVTNPDGTLTAHFYLSETITGDVPTDTEYVQAAKILLGEEV